MLVDSDIGRCVLLFVADCWAWSDFGGGWLGLGCLLLCCFALFVVLFVLAAVVRGWVLLFCSGASVLELWGSGYCCSETYPPRSGFLALPSVLNHDCGYLRWYRFHCLFVSLLGG